MVKSAWKHLQPEKQFNILNTPVVVYKSLFFFWFPVKTKATVVKEWEAVVANLLAWGVYTSKGKPGYYKGPGLIIIVEI